MASSTLQLAQIKPLKESMSLMKKIESTLQSTPIKHIASDGTVTLEYVACEYYLSNDSWNLEHFLNLNQFKHMKATKWAKAQTQKINFNFKQNNLNLEAKFVFHQLLFNDTWAPSATFTTKRSAIGRLAKFVNEYYPEIESFAEMQSDAFVERYVAYLTDLGLVTYYEEPGRKGFKKSENLACPSIIFNHLQRLCREEYFESLTTDLWEEDVWDIRYFRKFGIDAPRSSGIKSIVFTDIKEYHMKTMLKKYLKGKLLTSSISWGTAHAKSIYIRKFLNFLSEKHPSWTDLTLLSREDIMAYYEELSLYANTTLKENRKDANPKHYTKSMLSQLRTFITDLQIMEYPESPNIPAIQLIRFDDTKGYTSTVPTKIKYVPDFVLEQFFENISLLPEKYLPVVLTMYYTGLRVSDTLELKNDCLVKINGQYWVETYVWKTKTLDHRCPITEEFAMIIQKYIEQSKAASNSDNNPENFIFVNFTGLRKGEPYSQHALTDALNTFSRKTNIRDENGNIFRFKNHAFRHTFSVKMINNGADILTVMELLAHATPKMTMAYAKLLESTKRKAFEKVMSTGVFTFSTSGGEELVYDSNLPQDLLNNLWQRHKLNAVDTPYGTCLQRKNGQCGFAKQPPCLTCNDGKPCKDLCIGVFEGDKEKYDILIESTEKLVAMAENHNREDMAQENRALLDVLTDIKNVISDGGIIYGRTDRLLEDNK